MIQASDRDTAAMQMALSLAREMPNPDDIPIAALVVDQQGAVLASAVNEREATGDPTAHAEVLALRAAARARGNWRLADTTLIVTMEPCPMCAGAAQLARVSAVVFGAWNDDYGAAGSMWDVLRDGRLPVQTEVIGGVLAEECGELVREFFRRQRGAKAARGDL
ncbi:MAG: nucleoside deaminase [Candidatus Nanopelagicales bacterium]